MPSITTNARLNEQFRDWVALATRNDEYLTDWEIRFVESMRRKLQLNDDADELGLPPDKRWNPTSNQWNTLKIIIEEKIL